MTTTTDDPTRAEVERVLRRIVDVTVVAPWLMATWAPRCVLRRLGVTGSGPAEAWRTVTDLARQAVSPADATLDGYVTADGEAAEPPEAAVTPTSEAAAPDAPAATELPIEDYESLAASQVVTRLRGLTASERQVVREFEAAHRSRRTILGKLDQLDQLEG